MRLSPTRVAWTLLASVAAGLFLVEAVRLVRLYRSVKGNKKYWDERASTPPQSGDFVYVALGDSVAQGIGASRPENGYVGLIEKYLSAATGRSVQVINVSTTGATCDDVIRDQLPKIKELRPDLVTLDVGSNDVNKRLPEGTFVENFATILDALPGAKTIVADLPTFERGPKQSTLLRLNTEIHREVAAHQAHLAPIYERTSTTIHDWMTYGADFFHPSNKGHRNWFDAFRTELHHVVDQSSSA